jgi:3-deoxy-D-manno-octulosonic-acid transferase
MGGSLIGDKVGGHNLLEPAALGKPLLNGPSYYNFNEIMQLLQSAKAVEICMNAQEITMYLLTLFSHPDKLSQIGERALLVLKDNKGAVKKTLNDILSNN